MKCCSESEVPKVSVILPNYNYENYIGDRIDSILSQTFNDFELIILDDASTDKSRDVIEKYRNDSHITHIVYNQHNSGKPCLQWKKGWELARGKYIWIAEADDLAETCFLEKAVAALESEEHATLFFCGSLQNDKYGVFRKDRYDKWAQPRFRLKNKDSLYVFDGDFYMNHYLVWSNCIYNASGAVFLRSATDAKDWEYCCTFYGLGDWALWSRIAEKGKVIISKEKLNKFRRHNNSATRRFSKNFRNLIERMIIVRDNISELDERKKHIIISRLKKISMCSARNKKDRQAIRDKMNEVYGTSIMKKAKNAGLLNSVLIASPWHVCQSNDHWIKPDII